MSGGSWDYVYSKVQETAHRLTECQDSARVALGIHLLDVAKALRAIEWNDSGDGDDEEESLLKKCVPVGLEIEVLQGRAKTLKAQADSLCAALGEPAKPALDGLNSSARWAELREEVALAAREADCIIEVIRKHTQGGA